MKGGIDAWNGLVSRAEVDQGIFLIDGDETPEEALSLAYGLEEGTHRFYLTLAQGLAGGDRRDLFEQLGEAEIRHKETIWEQYRRLTEGRMTRETFERGIVAKTLEGGKPADQILAEHPDWIQDPRKAFELAMSLETDGLDLYLRMAQKSQKEEARTVFYTLAKEEQKHLKSLGELFRKELKV